MGTNMTKTAATSVPVHPLLAERWSPRGFDAAHTLGEARLHALLEAARWAPSANNSQPWRFLVTRRGEDAFTRLLDLLNPGNRVWAGAAGALLLVAAETVGEDGRARPWALYDTGQAVACLTLQAQADGLSVHQMGGFDAAAAREAFGLGAALTPVVVVAVGCLDAAAELPEPLAARESAPRTRHALDALLLPAVPGPEHRAA
ncbi:nitroreductase family protein [Planomonospora alba]|uniref:Nitroreductase family protein n=1 Tax=Planomonospora alba TaxID=161354 RepID=A0ABP6NXD4_9ACTN